MTGIKRVLVATALAGGAFFSHPATAAQSYDSCKNFIDSLPATISTQGVWCLRKDLATAQTSGSAIEVNANNVTIDCNDFKIGGLAAGNASQARGVTSFNRQNTTVRNCNIRGFHYGLDLVGAGHLVEDNRFDNNLFVGIAVQGDNNRVRRNAVYDTGGAPGTNQAYGIYGGADIVDNTVSGLFVALTGYVYGITSEGHGGYLISGNQVSGFEPAALDGGVIIPRGIDVPDRSRRIVGNHLVFASQTSRGYGMRLADRSYCIGNTVQGFALNMDSRCVGDGNFSSDPP